MFYRVSDTACTGGCILAVVGSRKCAEAETETRSLIHDIFDRHRPRWFVSGGAVGGDTFAEDEANLRGMEERKTIHLPEGKGWKFYQARDILIAEDAECLACITHFNSKTHGASWTASKAEKLGKRVDRFIVGYTGGRYGQAAS